MTPVEQAARALLECDAAGPTSLSAARVVVRTVLESLLIPDEEMLRSALGDAYDSDRFEAMELWQSIMRAALAEDGK